MLRAVGACLVSFALVAGCASQGAGQTSSIPSVTSATPSVLPTASQAPSTPSATPLTSPGPLAWHEVARIPGSTYDLISFRGGYVALGHPSYYSADGRSWRTISVSVGSPALENSGVIATDGDRLLAGGGYDHAPCAEPADGGGPACAISPEVWFSTDGTTWQARHPTVPSAGAAEEIAAVWPDGAGGWEAALSSWSGELRTGDTIWHSSDGLSWSFRARSPIAWEYLEPIGAIDSTGRRILVAGGWGDSGALSTQVLTSTDGRTWVLVPGFPSDGIVDAVLAPASGDGRWLLGGRVESGVNPVSGGPDTITPTIWTSSDAQHWSTVSLPGFTTDEAGPGHGDSVIALVRSPFGYVAIVPRNTGSGDTYETWLSPDGTTWARLQDSPVLSVAIGRIDIAYGPGGLLGIGTMEDPEATVVWELR